MGYLRCFGPTQRSPFKPQHPTSRRVPRTPIGADFVAKVQNRRVPDFLGEMHRNSKSPIEMVAARLPKSLVNPLRDCLTPYILTSITRSWSKNLVIEGPKRPLQ